MRCTVLNTFLFVAILGLGSMSVAVPGKADGLKHPIELGAKCKAKFEYFLNWDRFYKVFAYAYDAKGRYTCAFSQGADRALEYCNDRRGSLASPSGINGNDLGGCKIYAKAPVNGKLAIVWKGKPKQVAKTQVVKAEPKMADAQQPAKTNLASLQKVWAGYKTSIADQNYEISIRYSDSGEKYFARVSYIMNPQNEAACNGSVDERGNLSKVDCTPGGMPRELLGHVSRIELTSGGASGGAIFVDKKLAQRIETATAEAERQRQAELKAKAEKKRLAELARKNAEAEKKRLAKLKAAAEKKRLAELARKKAAEAERKRKANAPDRKLFAKLAPEVKTYLGDVGAFLKNNPTTTILLDASLAAASLKQSLSTKSGKVVKASLNSLKKVMAKSAEFAKYTARLAAKRKLQQEKQRAKVLAELETHKQLLGKLLVDSLAKSDGTMELIVSIIKTVEGGMVSKDASVISNALSKAKKQINANAKIKKAFQLVEASLRAEKKRLAELVQKKAEEEKERNRQAELVRKKAEAARLHRCDELAAHPLDSNKKVPGVLIKDIVPAEAIKACRSALASFPEEQRVQFQLGRALFSAEQYQEAITWFRKGAKQGYAAAQANLGYMYYSGKGVPKDDKTAVKWWTLAAEKGHAGAQGILGAMYEEGKSVPQSNETAVKWYRLAAEQGYAAAQNDLGNAYDVGRGVPKDDKESVKWRTLAAKQGNTQAQFNLGNMYYSGRGVPQDHKTAVKWWTLAAEKGNADAQTNLGVMYFNGKGVPQDYKTAVKWYRLAAEQGHAGAQNGLGWSYKQGEGVAQDDKTAAKWFRLAAAQGNKRAKSNLEKLTEKMATEKRQAEQARKKAEAEKKRQEELAKAEKKRQEELAKVQKQIELEKADYNGKLLFTVRRAENFLKNSFEKDDAGKITSVDTKVGCEYFFRISNYTNDKVFVNRFTINTDKSASFTPADRKTIVSIEDKIYPGQSTEKQSKAIIARWLSKSRKTAPDESQQAAAISKFGCKAQVGSVYISFGKTKEFLKFSKKRRISKRKLKKLIAGNAKGETPLRIAYE